MVTLLNIICKVEVLYQKILKLSRRTFRKPVKDNKNAELPESGIKKDLRTVRQALLKSAAKQRNFAADFNFYFVKTALILLIPAETFSCLLILKVPSSPVVAAWGPPQISLENSPME